jgi:diadenosine tetraphosphate (Ap4A) HIT family hydrolase
MEVELIECLLCQGQVGDEQLERIEVWQDAYWRLTASLSAEVPGFSYLEPKRHIANISALDGEEARTFGSVMAQVTTALREVTDAEEVYVYIFGEGASHLHVHLAPHHEDDALYDQMIRGEIITEILPSGITRLSSREFPPLSEAELLLVAERIRQRLESPQD